ncbi:hypothetical protein [Pseudonocardia sp.]|uniref:hypothetical protein n=1 Tax=Pseudonocardia sp. TaxID=60912 RepID=UPI003D0B3CE0
MTTPPAEPTGRHTPPGNRPGPPAPREDTTPARGRDPEVVALVCPECGEDAIEQPPAALVPYEAHDLARPVYSHPDGEPLCPVVGPHGYQPADPVEITAAVDDEIIAAHDAVARALAGISPPSADIAHRDQLTRWHHDTHDARHHDDGLADDAGTP